MNYSDRLVIVVRLFGTYWILKVLQSIFLLYAMGFKFSQDLLVTKTLLLILIEFGIGSFLLTSPKSVVGLLMLGIKDTKDSLFPRDKNASISFAAQIVGLFVFGHVVKQLPTVAKDALMYSYHPLASSLFIGLVLELIISLILMFNSRFISRFLK